MNTDLLLTRHSFVIARRSFQKANLPFGCLLADANGNILKEGENTVITDKDSIAHCEINLVHRLADKYDVDFLHHCTVYASTEACPMCTAAIFWSGIGRIVYAMSKEVYHQIAGTTDPAYIFDLSSRQLLSYGRRIVTVTGPLLEEEAAEFYQSLKN